jgi:hypothetical protein
VVVVVVVVGGGAGTVVVVSCVLVVVLVGAEPQPASAMQAIRATPEVRGKRVVLLNIMLILIVEE